MQQILRELNILAMIIEKLNTNIWEQDFFWNSIFDLFLFSLKVFVFSLGLFVWRSFWSCLCVVLSVWDISLLLIQPSLLILLYFCLALLLLSEKFRLWRESSFYIRSVSRYDVKIEKRVFKKEWFKFYTIYDDTLVISKHLFMRYCVCCPPSNIWIQNVT